jgi:uncharacterized lipoprotein YehR (DUF1307 family)
MKKITALFLILVLALSLCACKKKEKEQETPEGVFEIELPLVPIG